MTLRTSDVAELLDTTPAAIYKLVQAGTIKAYRRGRGARLVFDTRSVWAERERRKAAKKGERRG